MGAVFGEVDKASVQEGQCSGEGLLGESEGVHRDDGHHLTAVVPPIEGQACVRQMSGTDQVRG